LSSLTKTELRAGRYVVVGVLGTGAQGKTLDAVDKREGRPVAIKRFDVGGARSWKDVELAEREARVLAALDHPMLPEYVEHFEEDGVLYLVMEKIEGTSLATLRARGPLAPREIRRLLDDARTVLRYLHERVPPVVHRDLKPGNVIRRPDGSFAFVDFGAVRDRMRPEGGSTVVGTFGYMAPEQFQGRAGPGSDVYAIGATALAMATGREPEELPHKGLSFDLDAALPAGFDPALKRALAAMLEPDPDRRVRAIPPLDAPPSARSPQATVARHESAREAARAAHAAAHEARYESAREAARAAARAARAAAHEARRVARAAKDEARALRRREKAERRARRRGPVPFPIRLMFVVGLVVAQVAVALALRVIVPLVLVLLSVVFGEPLRRAARKVSEAGGRAGAALGRAHGALEGTEPTRVRVEGVEEEERVRVGGGETAEDARGEDAEEAEEAEEAAEAEEAEEAEEAAEAAEAELRAEAKRRAR
jgi:hypothetical protein